MTASVSGVATGVDKNDQATSVALLREMLRIRELEQRSLDLSTATPPEVIGSAHFCAGQEAVPVGTLAGLELTLTRSSQPIEGTDGPWPRASLLPRSSERFASAASASTAAVAGSAYMMAPDRRFIGENSIVGAGVPIACGVAMANVASQQREGGCRLHWRWSVQPGLDS